ncbi:MAG: FAD-binding oxidoreductase, partial [Deltaproteobacteria bacterium]|nr:FAD-binding oxidoreductase [Deltaproteobacteria bacterium]
KPFLDLLVSNRNIEFDLVRKHEIQVDCADSGMLEAGVRPQKVFEHKEPRWRKLGYDVQTVGAEQLSELLGTNVYKYGIYWKEGGRVNPYHMTNGMVDAAHRHGAKVFGESPVVACEREAFRWRVRTGKGSVLAKLVILCTSGHVGNAFFPHLERTQFPLVVAGLATEPLPASLLDVINPSRAAFMQAPTGLYPLLIDGNDRLITSTIPGPGHASDGRRYFDLLIRYLYRTWPETRDVEIGLSSYWTGVCASSSSVLHEDYPKFFKVDEGVLGFMNLGTWGNVMGPLLGMHLAHAIADERLDDLVLPLEKPTPVRFRNAFELKIRYGLMPLARMADRFQLA